jgi:hypothetical protein
MLIANKANRTLSGLALPFGEFGRTNMGKVKAHKGTLKLAPVVTINSQHDRVSLGLAASMVEEEDGWHGVFNIAEGPEGDQLLAEYEADQRRGLSVEIPDAVTRAGDLLAGTITAVSAVIRGAFPSALMAADAGELPDDLPDWFMPSEASSENTEEIVVNGVTYVRTTTTTNKTTVTPKGGAAPQEAGDMGNENETPTPIDAALVGSLVAALGGTPAATTRPAMTADEAFRAMAAKHRTTGSLEAALAVVPHDDGDNDGDGPGEISAPQGWLGQVWQEQPYVRRFAPLLTQGILTHYRELGFRVVTEPTVAAYAGNGAEVPSGGMTVAPMPYVVSRLAHGADIDRRYQDFNDSDLLAAFVAAQVKSYEVVIDGLAEDFIAAQADVEAAGDFIAGISPGVTGIVDGALALIADRFRPTSAVMGADLYRSVLLTPKDDIAEYLTQAFGLEEGNLSGFRIVPSAKPAYAGKVVVMDSSTLRLKELGGGAPVRVEAEKPSNGVQTLAVFGYYSLQNLEDGGARIVTPLTVAPV